MEVPIRKAAHTDAVDFGIGKSKQAMGPSGSKSGYSQKGFGKTLNGK